MAPLIFIIVLSVLDVMRINIIIIGFLFEISELLLYFSIALRGAFKLNLGKNLVFCPN